MLSWIRSRTELRFSPFSFSGQCKQKVMGSILTSMSDFGSSLIFRKKCLGEHQGSVRAVSRPLQLLLFSGGFGNSSRAVFGQFYSFSDSFRAVFRQKMTDWTVQSVIVNR